jgi:hypothetical protein
VPQHKVVDERSNGLDGADRLAATTGVAVIGPAAM